MFDGRASEVEGFLSEMDNCIFFLFAEEEFEGGEEQVLLFWEVFEEWLAGQLVIESQTYSISIAQ